MDQIHVEGGPRLEGEVRVSGSKNATLPLMAAALLGESATTLRNVPDLADVTTLLELLRTMGVDAQRVPGAERHVVRVHAPASVLPEAPYDLVRKMRASVLVLGPLLARFGRARVSLPGGCAIGARPIDQHLKGFRALGAEILLEGGYVEARARRLRGATVRFDKITVTGTENVLMAAVLAEGTTVLENAAREPEVEDLARALNAMGARIRAPGRISSSWRGSRGSPGWSTRSSPTASRPGPCWSPLPSPAGTCTSRAPFRRTSTRWWASCGRPAARSFPPRRASAARARTCPSRSTSETTEHPGFPTDMQAQLMALLSVARGTSVISENIFENRFMHVAELRRMGADIRVEGHTAVVKGVHTLSGAPVMATDLRASASLILAGLRAGGTTRVARVYHLDRGYEALERKLQTLGARTTRVK